MKVGLNEKNEWIELPAFDPRGLYVDPTHKQNLDIAKKVIKEDWDMVFVYDGYEGTGKSVKCMQDAFYCDPTLNIDRIVFNPEAFKAAVLKAQKYQAIVFDEAYGGLSSKGAMSGVNRSVTQMLTVIRAKNLFIFIVLPSFFDLDKYVALWRSRALIHVYTGMDFQRGFFEFYNKDRKKTMYVLGKKLYDYSHVKPNYRARFTNTYVIDEALYREKKETTSMIGEQDISPNNVYMRSAARMIRNQITNSLKTKDLGFTKTKMAQVLDITRSSINRYLAIELDDDEYDVDKDVLAGEN